MKKKNFYVAREFEINQYHVARFHFILSSSYSPSQPSIQVIKRRTHTALFSLLFIFFAAAAACFALRYHVYDTLNLY